VCWKAWSPELARCSWLLQEIVCRPDRQKLVMTNYLFVYDSCCKLLSFQTHCIAPTRNDPLKTNMVDLRNWSLVATIKALARNTSQDHGSESSPRPLPKRQKLGTSHMLMYQQSAATTKMHLLYCWSLEGMVPALLPAMWTPPAYSGSTFKMLLRLEV